MTSNKRKWTGLDNAAKIFPATSTKIDTKVFRFSCELNQSIDVQILQASLDDTVAVFPIFRTVLKKGAFWYYLEETDLKPIVELEATSPCSRLYNKNMDSLLFRVNYYNNRINLEVYHALSDGTGALQFLRMLVFKYITKRHEEDFSEIPEFEYDASEFEKSADSFKKHYNPSHKMAKQKKPAPKAFKITAENNPQNALHIIEGTISVQKLLEKAHEHNTTLTIFLTAVFIKSILTQVETAKKNSPIVIAVPVNLRSFFESKSIRNFFSVINVVYNNMQDNTLENIIARVKAEFKAELTSEQIQEKLDTLMSLEINYLLKPIPIFVKDLILKVAYKISSATSTASLSNIGKITMPEEICKYIKLFSVFISTNHLQMCTCSFKDNFIVSVVSVFENQDIPKYFFRELTQMGLSVEISSTLEDIPCQ